MSYPNLIFSNVKEGYKFTLPSDDQVYEISGKPSYDQDQGGAAYYFTATTPDKKYNFSINNYGHIKKTEMRGGRRGKSLKKRGSRKTKKSRKSRKSLKKNRKSRKSLKKNRKSRRTRRR